MQQVPTNRYKPPCDCSHILPEVLARARPFRTRKTMFRFRACRHRHDAVHTNGVRAPQVGLRSLAAPTSCPSAVPRRLRRILPAAPRTTPRRPFRVAFTALPQHSGVLWSAWNSEWSVWVPVGSAWIPVEVGGKYSFRGRFRAPLNTELEAYLAKVRVASSSLVSRSTPCFEYGMARLRSTSTALEIAESSGLGNPGTTT